MIINLKQNKPTLGQPRGSRARIYASMSGVGLDILVNNE